MFLLIFCIAVVLATIGFSATIPSTQFNPFFAYIILQLQVFLENPVLLLFSFGLVFLVVLLLDKTPLRQKTYGKLIIQSLFAIGIGSIASFVLLIAIAWLQLNAISLLLRTNPAVLGITDNVSAITKSLQSESNPPDILPSSPDGEKQLVAVAHATVGTTNFYGNTLLPNIPSWSILKSPHRLPSAILLDNILILNTLDTKTLSVLSPVLGHVLVQTYFPLRSIKSNPETQVLTPQIFTTLQKQDNIAKAKQLTADISLLKTQIASLSATIQKNTDTIAGEQTQIQNTYDEKKNALGHCESQGSYISGKFVPTYSLSYCRNLAATYDKTVDSENKTIDTLSQDVQQKKSQQQLYNTYLNLLLAEQSAFTLQTTTIPDELGVFNPPNKIELVVFSNHTEEAADYMETLTHEYLHFASFNPTQHFASSFFEEGLTEYFARKIIADELHVTTHLGYPVTVALITQMMQVIPESEFTDLYFNKDELGLENKLNQAYGDTFYTNNYPLFQALQYTIDPVQKLQIANTIMAHIHGQKLSQKDMQSSFSSL